MTIIDFWRTFLSDALPLATRAGWVAIFKAIDALEMTGEEREFFTRVSGRTPPTHPVSEAWTLAGRRSGKSQMAALQLVYRATCKTYPVAPGEVPTLLSISVDRRSARVVKGYCSGLVRSTPILAAELVAETALSLKFRNGNVIEIATASWRNTRGYTIPCAIVDEICFLPSEHAANPDDELLDALRPAMISLPESLLLCISSVYAKSGAAYQAWRQHYGRDSDVLVVKCATQDLNPTIPAAKIARAYERDAVVAAAEYGSEWRSDREALFSVELLSELVTPGARVRPPRAKVSYRCFVDVAGGTGADSACCAVAHTEVVDGRATEVLDAILEVAPPFSPEKVCEDFAALAKSYRVVQVTGDPYAGDFPREQFRKRGLSYVVSPKSKSEIYRALVPLVTSGRVDLLDDPKLLAQAANLERRVGRSGRDSIDHRDGFHDDRINAGAGVLVSTVDESGYKVCRL